MWQFFYKFRLKARLGLCLLLALPALISFPDRAGAGDSICQAGSCPIILCCSPPGVSSILNTAFSNHRTWLTNFYNSSVLPAIKSKTEQLTSIIMLQGQMIGGFYDAQAHSAAMLSLQRMSAESVNEYQPSIAVCRFGSISKALAASDSLGRRTKIGIAERAQNRQSLNVNSAAAFADASSFGRVSGRSADMDSRLDQFVSKFCNITDSNAALNVVCDSNLATTALDGMTGRQLNADIDYTRNFDIPLTLDLDFSGASTTVKAGHQNLVAMNDNLYAHDIIVDRPEPTRLDLEATENLAMDYQDFKTAIAKRSVVENSFASVAALKTPGTNSSTSYMRTIMTQMGLTTADVDRFIGTSNPSYFAQMEVLTRQIYQDPGFYVSLMESPANVQRQQAAMKALGSMQERDILESMQRSEMLLSTLLEIYTARQQRAVFNRMSNK